MSSIIDGSDIMEDLQADFAAVHESYVYFANLAIFARRKGVLQSNVENSLNVAADMSGSGRIVKPGACLVMEMPMIDCPDQEGAGPALEIIFPGIAYEKPEINRSPAGTNLTAYQITLNSIHLMHGRILSPYVSQIRVDKRAADPFPTDDEKKIAYQIFYRARFQLDRPLRVSMPTIAGTADAVQLNCNTPGASIYYTTNGTYPSVGNPTAVLYGSVLVTEDGQQIGTETGDVITPSSPFPVAPGTRVRVVAFKDGTHQPSDTKEFTF